MTETRDLDVYWSVQYGRRWSVSLSASDAWRSLESLAAYHDNPDGWTVEQARETVPVSMGTIVEGEGELVVLDRLDGRDDDCAVTLRQPYKAVHVFWNCPLCGQQHNTGLYDDPVNQTGRASNPSIWFCERGEGIVLVRW